VLPLEGIRDSADVDARVVRESVGGFGSLRVRTVVDSGSRAWISVTCSMWVALSECGATGHKETGVASKASVDSLFALAQLPPFRALRARYEGPGPAVDGFHHSLAITTRGRSRTIEWSDGGAIPEVLWQYDALLYRSTRGAPGSYPASVAGR